MTEKLKDRIDDLTRRHANVTRQKAELRGQLEAKKQELVALSKEIQRNGYDPKKLKEERDRLEHELSDLIAACDRDLSEVETALAAFDGSIGKG